MADDFTVEQTQWSKSLIRVCGTFLASAGEKKFAVDSGARVRRVVANLAMFAFAAWSNIASSTPAFVYDFVVESFGCYRSIEPACGDLKEQVDSMSATLSLEAVIDGSATYTIRLDSSFVKDFSNDGLLALTVPFTRPSDYLMEPTPNPGANGVFISIAFDVSHVAYLVGTARIGGLFDGLTMSTLGSAPLWFGEIGSDGPVGRAEFTGEWRLARVVSEPSALAALLGSALAELFVRGRRRRTARTA